MMCWVVVLSGFIAGISVGGGVVALIQIRRDRTRWS
jgi:hypothetical protein